MRKVGATTSGSVIVEMNLAQFEALKLFMDPQAAPEQSVSGSPEKQEVKAMAVKRKLDHIRACVMKLKPETQDSLLQLIRTVHPFTGAYAEKEIDHLMKILTKEKLFTLAEDGTISYEKSSVPEQEEAAV